MTFRQVFEELGYTEDDEINLFITCAIESGHEYRSEDSEIDSWKSVAEIMSLYPAFDGSGLLETMKCYAKKDMSNVNDFDRLQIMRQLIDTYQVLHKALMNVEYGKDISEFLYKSCYEPCYEPSSSGFKEKSIKGFVYIGNEVGTDLYKIGMTKNIEDRESALRCGNIRLKFIAYKYIENYSRLEALLHELFRHKNVGREWFRFSKDEVDELIRVHGFSYALEGDDK